MTILWFTLYRDFPLYPPNLGLPLAIVAILFLEALALFHRIHGGWPGIAQFGFVISGAGLVLWTVGGTMNALGLQVPVQQSAWGRFTAEILGQPQPGWGLFCVGLMPIGLSAFRRKLSLPMRLLLPIGGLLVLGPPLKYLLGERTGGLTVLLGFGVGWLTISALLLSENESAPLTAIGAGGDDSMWHNPGERAAAAQSHCVGRTLNAMVLIGEARVAAAVAQLEALGVYELAATQEAFTRSRRRASSARHHPGRTGSGSV